MDFYIKFGLIIIAIFLLRLFAPKIKGAIGEKIVSNQLNKIGLENYVVINDLILKTKKGTSQIDHVVISPYGIIVIETKFYKGWIYGSEKGRNWTQVIYRNKNKFLNPIIQNKGHIKALKENLSNYSDIPYYSIVVLAGSGEFKSFDKVSTPVIYPRRLYETILGQRGIQVLSEEKIKQIFDILTTKTFHDRKTRREHIKNIANIKAEVQSIKVERKCPKCGSNLIERDGKFGKFLGCRNYPKCKYTINISS